MANYKVKDADLADKYFASIGDGGLTTPYLSISSDFYTEVQKGNVPKHSIIQKFGSIDNVTTTLTPISTGGVYPTPTTVTALEILSSSANDAAAGTGARSVTIEGISDTNGAWTFESQTVTMNGVTPVAIPNSMRRVFRMYVATSGSYADATTPSHNSTITLRVSGGGATWSILASEGTFGLGQSEIGLYTVPAGYTAYFLDKNVTVEDSKSADVFLYVREGADTTSAPFTPMLVKELERNLSTNSKRQPKSPMFSMTGPADVGFMGKSTSTTTDISVEFEILLVED